MFSELPLKSKLILILALVTFFILGSSVAVFSLYDSKIYRTNLLNQQNVLGKIIAERSSAALAFNDKISATDNLSSFRTDPSITAACIYRNGELFASYLQATTELKNCPETAPGIPGHMFTANHLETLQKIQINNMEVGQLHIISSLSQIEKRANYFTTSAIGLLLIVGTIGLIIASRLIAYIIRPLYMLETTAKVISEKHDYSVRSESQHDDDIGELINTFNDMLETIESQNNALKNSEETLKTIINDAPDLMQIVDREGVITFTNRSEDALRAGMATPATIFDGIDAEHQARARQALAIVFKTGMTTQFEALDTDKECWFANHLGPMKEDGEITSVLVMKRDISALKTAHEKLTQIAFFDPLTGLPNRRLFKERLEDELQRSRKQQNHVALLFLDLDNFKRVNDTLGHDAGDKLLTTISNRLVSCVRNEDLVSRLGGDEFTVLLGGLTSDEPPKRIAEKILEALREPITLGRDSITATFSIGIAMAPDHASSAAELMQHADIAMYEAKSLGKNTYKVFDQSMVKDKDQALNIETELRAAIDRQEFEVYYQPQVALDSMEVVGIEALLRWNHPTRGLLSPISFIDELESCGFMMEVTKWTLDTACKEIRAAGNSTEKLKGVKLAINISARQFRDPNLVSFIERILESSGFPSESLELEITESSLVTDFDQSIKTMDELRSLGISLSIDDFGTGYSSLSYLRKLPVNLLKIDRSFIKELPYSNEDKEISSAVIAMAHKLNIEVLAEGIETVEQLQFLKDQHCDYAQGYYISPPVPVNALTFLSGHSETEKILNVPHAGNSSQLLRLVSSDD